MLIRTATLIILCLALGACGAANSVPAKRGNEAQVHWTTGAPTEVRVSNG